MLDIQILKTTLSETAAKVAKFAGKGITEQDTKNALIEPILGALGWTKTDLDLVRAEYRHTSKDNPTDYALFARGQPVMFVEAKALDVSVSDHKVVAQVISYANVSGVRWALLTNGREWALYKVFADVQGDQKRLFSVDITKTASAEWLRWIVPEHLAGNELDNVWRHFHAERRVRDLLRTMIANRDSRFVKFLASQGQMDAKDVTIGVYHLRATFDEPEPGAPLLTTHAPAAGVRAAQGQRDASAATPAAPPRPGVATTRGSGVSAPRGEAARKAWATRRAATARAILPTPQAGSKPVRFWIGSRSWQVQAWRDLPVNTCAFLAEARREQFARALAADEFLQRKRRLLGTSPKGLRRPVPIVGGFVEVNLSASDCVRLAEGLLVFCGIEPSTAGYESRADAADRR